MSKLKNILEIHADNMKYIKTNEIIIGFLLPITNKKYKLLFKKSNKQIIHYQFFSEIKDTINKISKFNINKYTQIPRCRFIKKDKNMSLYIPDNFEIDEMGLTYIIQEFGHIDKYFEIKIEKTIAERLENDFNLISPPVFI